MIFVRCRDGFELPAVLVLPPGGQPAPAVLVVTEPFGVTDEMLRIARTIAEAGYVVMVPDLLKRGSWFSCVRRLMSDLRGGGGRSVDDLLDARDWLAAQSTVLDRRVGVLGFCMGGGFALLLSRTGLFRVAAPFYGPVPPALDGACPIVASY